jgi:hypothetical protein
MRRPIFCHAADSAIGTRRGLAGYQNEKRRKAFPRALRTKAIVGG